MLPKEITKKLKNTITVLDKNLSYSDVAEVAKTIVGRKVSGGKIITSGMGKAGIVAQYLSTSLCSIGVSATFLHPGDAQHGDLGIVSHNDMIIFFSNSGKTREMLELRQLIENMETNNFYVLVTSSKDKNLHLGYDVVLNIGKQEELCMYGLVPTASVMAMIAVCEVLIFLTSIFSNLTKNDYFKLHHGGYIGSLKK